jgi:hypothetical protein
MSASALCPGRTGVAFGSLCQHRRPRWLSRKPGARRRAKNSSALSGVCGSSARVFGTPQAPQSWRLCQTRRLCRLFRKTWPNRTRAKLFRFCRLVWRVWQRALQLEYHSRRGISFPLLRGSVGKAGKALALGQRGRWVRRKVAPEECARGSPSPQAPSAPHPDRRAQCLTAACLHACQL